MYSVCTVAVVSSFIVFLIYVPRLNNTIYRFVLIICTVPRSTPITLRKYSYDLACDLSISTVHTPLLKPKLGRVCVLLRALQMYLGVVSAEGCCEDQLSLIGIIACMRARQSKRSRRRANECLHVRRWRRRYINRGA